MTPTTWALKVPSLVGNWTTRMLPTTWALQGMEDNGQATKDNGRIIVEGWEQTSMAMGLVSIMGFHAARIA